MVQDLIRFIRRGSSLRRRHATASHPHLKRPDRCCFIPLFIARLPCLEFHGAHVSHHRYDLHRPTPAPAQCARGQKFGSSRSASRLLFSRRPLAKHPMQSRLVHSGRERKWRRPNSPFVHPQCRNVARPAVCSSRPRDNDAGAPPTHTVVPRVPTIGCPTGLSSIASLNSACAKLEHLFVAGCVERSCIDRSKTMVVQRFADPKAIACFNP